MWEISIRAIEKPGLNQYRLTFTLLKDGADYITRDLIFTPVELLDKTQTDRTQYIKDAMKVVMNEYIVADSMGSVVSKIVGQQFTV